MAEVGRTIGLQGVCESRYAGLVAEGVSPLVDSLGSDAFGVELPADETTHRARNGDLCAAFKLTRQAGVADL